MLITTLAEKHLLKMLPKNCTGFSFRGYVGSCRGSTPILKPLENPASTEQVYMVGTLRFFVINENFELLDRSSLDYDNSILGKGLNMTWQHWGGCHCKN